MAHLGLGHRCVTKEASRHLWGAGAVVPCTPPRAGGGGKLYVLWVVGGNGIANSEQHAVGRVARDDGGAMKSGPTSHGHPHTPLSTHKSTTHLRRVSASIGCSPTIFTRCMAGRAETRRRVWGAGAWRGGLEGAIQVDLEEIGGYRDRFGGVYSTYCMRGVQRATRQV